MAGQDHRRLRYPGLRAAGALGLILPFYLVLFASTYFLMERASAANFTQPLTRTDALYFTAFRRSKTGRTAVVLDLVLIGLAITLDPLPLTAFTVVLPSKRGVREGAAFVFGWLVSLAIVVTVTVLATGNNAPKPNTAPSLAALAAKIAIGVLLVLIAIRHIRRMARSKKPNKKSRPSGRSTWTPCPRGSPWSWPRRSSPGLS